MRSRPHWDCEAFVSHAPIIKLCDSCPQPRYAVGREHVRYWVSFVLLAPQFAVRTVRRRFATVLAAWFARLLRLSDGRISAMPSSRRSAPKTIDTVFPVA